MIKKLQSNFAVLPVLYLFVAVFIARDNVEYVYLSAIILVVLSAITLHRHKLKPVLLLARWMTVLAAIGLSAAVILSIEKVELLADPGRVASCSLSPIVACSPVISSPQSAAFGFANSFIGIFGFTAVFVAGMTIMAGAVKLSKLWWRTLLAGTVFGSFFSMWLIHEGVFAIGKLCLYCLLVWLVSFALLWLVTAHCIQNKYINLGTTLNKYLGYKYELITLTYLLIFMIIFYQWSDYWLSLF
jgi:uncharacterized membrane protein